MPDNRKLDYVEFQTRDLSASKAFFGQAFGWAFTDYGPEYSSFAKAEAGLDGGLYPGEPLEGALLVFYAAEIDTMLDAIKAAGGDIIKPIFDFPGGRRFHFREPGGNELAVWSDPV